MKLRRFTITFLLLVNSAALVFAILTLSNASPLSNVTTGEVQDAHDLLVVARGDASLVTVLGLLGIAANLVLGYLYVGNSSERGARRSDGPRITGE